MEIMQFTIVWLLVPYILPFLHVVLSCTKKWTSCYELEAWSPTLSICMHVTSHVTFLLNANYVLRAINIIIIETSILHTVNRKSMCIWLKKYVSLEYKEGTKYRKLSLDRSIALVCVTLVMEKPRCLGVCVGGSILYDLVLMGGYVHTVYENEMKKIYWLKFKGNVVFWVIQVYNCIIEKKNPTGRNLVLLNMWLRRTCAYCKVLVSWTLRHWLGLLKAICTAHVNTCRWEYMCTRKRHETLV